MSAADGRVYGMAIDNVTVAALQDIFSTKMGAANGMRIHWIHLESNSIAASPLRMRLRRATATITQGTGGTVITPYPVDVNDTLASAATGHANDTSQATTTGAFTLVAGFQWDTVLPWDFLPAPEDRPACAAAQGFVLDIPATPTSIVLSGFIQWSEAP